MSIIDLLEKLAYILSGILLVLLCLLLPILLLIEGQQVVAMRVWIFPLGLVLMSIFQIIQGRFFSLGDSMLFCSWLLLQYLNFGKIFILPLFCYVLCLLCVFYTNHPSDDIDSPSVVLSFNICLLPLYLGQKPPHCVIFY